MKQTLYIMMGLIMSLPAFGAPSAARRSMAGQMMAAPRATASVNQLNGMANMMPDVAVSQTGNSNATTTPDVTPDTPVVPDVPVVDMRDKEKAACLANNIGVGNTFVWASRFSNVNNYASMVEDVENPENNTCFVFVELKSNEPKVSVFDIDGKYYEMGDAITCGEWTDEAMLRERILDAKKNVRTWGTVAGAVGGAGIGVGAMELFGNKLIGGKVQGQASMESEDLLRSQVLTLKEKNRAEYDRFMAALKTLETECADDKWVGATKPDECANLTKYEKIRGL